MHVTYPLGLGFEHSQGNAISTLVTKSQVLNHLGILMPGRLPDSQDKLTLWPNKGFSKNHCWPDMDHEETLLVKQMVSLKVVVPTNYCVQLSCGFVVMYKLYACKY